MAAVAEAPRNFINIGAELHDLADTAAVISQLDFVITTDTSTANLAGGLGAPTWAMLKKDPDWRWMHGTWYPTVRQFRQKVSGEWGDVVARVAEAVTRRSIP
jgi:ADP-heptose:LPS heptosyltransferase